MEPDVVPVDTPHMNPIDSLPPHASPGGPPTLGSPTSTGPYYGPASEGSAGHAELATAIVAGRSAGIGFGSFVASIVLGGMVSVATGFALAADGDPGWLESVETLFWAAAAFLVVSCVTYSTGVIVGVRRFLPARQRLIPALVLLFSPALLVTLAGVVIGNA